MRPRSLGMRGAYLDRNRVKIVQPDVAALIREDEEKSGGPWRMGVVREFPAKSDADGVWTHLDGGGWLWTISVHAPEASGIRIRVRPWTPPPGAELIVYNARDSQEARGPMTSEFQPRKETLWTPTVYGDQIRLEYYLPPGVDRHANNSQLVIDGILYQYRSSDPGDELDCHKDVTCYPIWANEANGVGILGLIFDNNAYFCSGAMLTRASPAADATPLFLTAAHCGIDAVGNVEVVWFYQTPQCPCNPPGCNPPDVGALPRTHLAAVLVTDNGTDTTLLGLASNVPAGVTFLGWDSTGSDMGVFEDAYGIHHPRGSYKRIAIGDVITCFPYCILADPTDNNKCKSRTAKKINWDKGTTEPGSSGSPLFDSAGRVNGVLSCGQRSCDITNSYYGRLQDSYSALSPYLDPTDPVFVDVANSGRETGTASHPFNSVIEASFAVIRGSDVWIVSGSYRENLTIDKAMTLHAQNGAVTIGQ